MTTRNLILTGVCASLVAGAASLIASTAAIIMPAAAADNSQGGYVLSADEQKLDCKKLTGRMQVRILEVRGDTGRSGTTVASRLIRSAIAGTVGGTTAGGDPRGQNAADRAMLEAYNRQLVAKGCKSFNLSEELKAKDIKVSPQANVPAPGATPSKKP